MLSLLITSKARRALLVRFLTRPDERFYASQLIRDLGLSSSLAQKELGRLTAAGLLTSEREGNTRFYRLNRAYPLYPELRSIVYKTEGLGDLFRERLGDVEGIRAAFVYGSAASGDDAAGSDIDVLVIGDVDPAALDHALAKAEDLLCREVNATAFGVEEWRERLARGQSFATGVANGPRIMLIGSDDDLR
jgi:DNA-binding transcriptional ArsR family regulator